MLVNALPAPSSRRRRTERHLLLLLAALALVPWLVFIPAGRAAADDGTPIALAVPYVSQDDGTAYASANCGPASVAMVLRALGVDASVTELRAAVNRIQGTTRYDTGTALETLASLLQTEELAPTGLLAGQRFVPWTPEAVVREIRSAHPVIAEVRFRLLPGHADARADADHYVVLVGVDGDSILYHDPELPAAQNAPRAMPLATLVAAMGASGRPFAAIAPTQGAFPITPRGPAAQPLPAAPAVPLVELQPWQPPVLVPAPSYAYLWWFAAAVLLLAAVIAIVYSRRAGPVGALVFIGPRGERLGRVDLPGHPHSVRWNDAACARQLSSLDLLALRVDRGPKVAGLPTVQLSLVGGDGFVFGRILQDQQCLPVTAAGDQMVTYLAEPADSRVRAELENPLATGVQWPARGYQHLQPRSVA